MDGGPLNSAIGGTTLSAGLADSQAQIGQALGAGPGSDSMMQFAAAYRSSGGGPTLALLGFNPFEITATGPFHVLYWAAIVIFLGITTVVAMQRTLIGRQTLTGRHPLVIVAQVYFRLLVGVLIISNTPLIYAGLMTLNRVLSQGVQAMAAQSMGALLQTGSMGTLTFAQARIEAIRNAAARRAIALYPAGASRQEMVQIGTWYNATAGALNAALSAQKLAGQLPVLNSGVWSDGSTPDDRVSSYVGRNVVQNFSQLLADLGALPAASGSLIVAFPSGGAATLPLLSDALAQDDAQAAQAIAMPATPSSNSAFEAARGLYAKNVLSDTLAYLDTRLLAVLGASPTLGQRVKNWFSEKVEQAAATAGGFMTQWRAAVDWIGRGIGVVLTRMVAFFFSAGVGVLIEVELFALVLTVPLWLLPATEDAFYGVLRSLVGLSVAVPAYQFIMLLIDALMGLVLKYVLFGPLAGGASGAAAAAGGATYLVTAAVAIVGSGGEIVILVMFCYLVAYLFLAVYAALKTPKLVAVFLKGAGAAGMFLSTFATGLVSGAAAAFTTASVAGGAMASGGLGASGGAAARAAGGRWSSRPSLGPAAASTARTTPPAGTPPGPVPEAGDGTAAPIREAAGFGLRTFVECLQADSPAEGFHLAFRALETHRKQKERESETLHKARQKAEKAAAPPARRTRRSGAA